MRTEICAVGAAPLAVNSSEKINSFTRATIRRLLPALALAFLPAVAEASGRYGELPLSFEANQGQVDGQVRFLARGPGYGLYLTPAEAVLTLRDRTPERPPAVVRMRLSGADPNGRIAGLDPQPGTSNYFVGSPARWRRDVPHFAAVRYEQVYPGIDLVYYGNQGQLEYDFVVSPGADPGRIELVFEGVGRISVDDEGNLVLPTPQGDLVQRRPVVYQEVEGKRRTIEGRYVLRGARRAAFQVARYDATRPLVIDPVLAWSLSYSTYLGGGGTDGGYGIAVDSTGNAYIAGQTTSANFPTTAGAYQTANGGSTNLYDVFVVKLNPAGTALVYSTYIGGSGNDFGLALAIDSSGNAYVSGSTTSTNFPTTAGAFQTVSGGGSDGFALKLNAAGNALVYSTYLGGSGTDYSAGIAVDATGNAYVASYSLSTNFPTTAGAFQTASAGGYDAAVTKLNPSGAALVYSTYLGGSAADFAYGIAVDTGGNAYVAGRSASTNFPATAGAYQTAHAGSANTDDAYVAKLNPAGTALVWATYLGGTGVNDSAFAIALDSSGGAYVTGQTNSANFPTTPAAFQSASGGGYDAFVAKLSPTGAALVFSTYLGGSNSEYGYGVAVDAGGNVFVSGQTRSTDFPTTANALQTTLGGGYDAFVAKLDPAGGSLALSTYLGGLGNENGYCIALGSGGSAYVSGFSASANFPTTTGVLQAASGGGTDAFVVKILPAAATPTSTAVLSSLNPSFAGQAVTFTATVTGTNPTGTVQFMDGAASLGVPAALSGGVATYLTSALTVGSHPITAVYGGDPGNAGSTSPVLTQAVSLVPSVATVVSSKNPSTVGESVTFTATVTGTNPTGTVQFMDGAASLGAPVALSGGVAACSTSVLAAGSHSITAVYGGDPINAPATSAVLIQVVNRDEAIPTLSWWGMTLLGLAVAGVGAWLLAGRSRV